MNAKRQYCPLCQGWGCFVDETAVRGCVLGRTRYDQESGWSVRGY
uniref:Uncharacterized protein n=1 Tax=Anguilla anguilla TaxID=7936 RepID=A0A0E9UKR6_ANGAN